MSSHNKYCLSALTEIGCQVPNCPKTHDIRQCSCGLVILINQYNDHRQGKRHMRTITNQSTNQNPAPNVAPPSQTNNSRRTGTSNRRGGTAPCDFTHCEVCDKDIPSYRWGFHLTYADHIRANRLAATQAALNTAAQNKNGVTVSGEVAGVDFGVMELKNSVGPSAAQWRVVTIQKTNNSLIRLAGFRLTSLGRIHTQASR